MTFHLSLGRGAAAPGAPRQITLAGTDLVVGSALDCDWQLVDGVAARHCQFGYRADQWLIVDLGGGTMVNGRVLAGPAPVAPGDVIAIGGCIVTVTTSALQQASSAATMLLDAAGLTGAQVNGGEADILATAGGLLRSLVAGMVEQLVQRARAKAEMGAEATQFAFGAANPLKTLPADRALAALLAPQGGMMPADRAVADAFADLEAHGAATLSGMQEALAATLERFSPAAIRDRAQAGGLMSRIVPGAKEAALWQAYEREFDGVVKGSSDAFVELFAAEFRKAYQAVSSAPRRPS